MNSNLGTLMNINITGEVKNANTSVVYSKYGDITIENDSTANINGLIYVPLGTLIINSPNINLNRLIIADKIVINGSSVNIYYKDDIVSFIGTTSCLIFTKRLSTLILLIRILMTTISWTEMKFSVNQSSRKLKLTMKQLPK